MKLHGFTIFFSSLSITVTTVLSSFTVPLCLIDTNPSSLPLSASVSLTVFDKLVVALLRSLISRAFPTHDVASGNSSSFWNWTSSSLPVLSPPCSQSRAVVSPLVVGDRSSRSLNFLLAFINSRLQQLLDFLRTTWSQFGEF
ncbi:uncharacterized protein DS421_7g214790 [Arachis hypogaea]|nr:uncharacterized protein DS421_7g214790 [Arachis hypogaea]